MRTRLRGKITLLLIVCAALLAFAGTAMAITADPSGTTAPAPTIQSDKADYPPGATVTLTGSNWQPGESVHINVNDDQGKTWNYDSNPDVTADANGNISHSFNLPDWFAATYKVTATGAQSGTATTTFTDGNLASVSGKVTDSSTNAGISGATVTCNTSTGCNATFTATTDASGNYVFDGSNKLTFAGNSATLSLKVSKSGYTDGTISLGSVSNGATLTGKDVKLTASDTTAPKLNLPADITKEATGSNGAAVTYTATADDANPAHPTVTCSPASGSTFAIGTTTVNCEATDAAGNKATGSFTVTVKDTTAPNISGTPSDITKEATGANGATASWTAPTASDAVDGSVSVNCQSASGLKSGDTFPLGSTTITCTATDNAGNKATSTFKVTVVDTTAPNIANHADITGVEATGPDGATVNYTKPSASDAVDGNVEVSCTPASGTKFALGETTVTCTATDNAGNKATSTFKVTVVDTTPPNITNVPSDITKEATSSAGATVTFTKPTATDAVDGARTVSCSPDSGSTFSLGTTEVTCSATDQAGNTSTAKFNVTVEDTTAPNIANHADITGVEATGSDGATVNYTKPTATDAVDGSVEVSCTPASGTKFSLGTTEVTCTATDNAGNKATSKFNVTVVDTTGPVLTLPADITKEATGSNGAAVTYTATANDAVTGSRPVTCSPASGSTFSLGETTVNCSANDGSGNSSTGSFKVTVQDTTAPVIAAHLDVNATATSNAGATVTYSSPATSDAVDGAKTATCTPASGSTFAVGSTTVTCNATDAAGNSATPTTFKVNVAFGWSNFLQPINVPPATQSVFKLGSTVPVKFNLTGASAGITDGTFYLKYIRTGNGDGLGELETVATTTGTTGTQFRYDALAGQYIYNWSTKSVSQAGNYELRVYSDAAGTKLLGSVTIELKK